MQVTIIIPIHNSEKYLKECVESAMAQSFHEVEILCIDGGSTDHSFEIIKELQRKDARITCIQDPNTSYGHKINVGIAKALGRYIAILESDDKMAPDMIENLYNIAEKYDLDVVDADYCKLFIHKGKELTYPIRKYSKLEDYNCVIDYTSGKERVILNHGIWTALYKKDFLIEQNIKLNESAGASYQDLSFLFLTSFLARKVYHVNSPLYQYRIDNTNSSVKDNNKIFEIVGECEFLKKELEKRNVVIRDAWKVYYIRKYNAYYWNYCRLGQIGRAHFLEKYEEDLKRDIREGAVIRETFGVEMYERTFLLLDDKERFVNIAQKIDKKRSITELLDLVENEKNAGVVVFGAGVSGNRIIDLLLQNGNMIKTVCDNSKLLQGTRLKNFKICSVEEAVKQCPNAFYLIANAKYGEDMRLQLIKNGIMETNIAVF